MGGPHYTRPSLNAVCPWTVSDVRHVELSSQPGGNGKDKGCELQTFNVLQPFQKRVSDLLAGFLEANCANMQLESDTRVLAYEAGRKYNVRVNTISAGPLGSRAARAIGFIDDMIRCTCALGPAGLTF
eukprot:352502-Chlamydomonas_euryale.AAC.1